MIKTIKVKKQMNLHEMIKDVWENKDYPSIATSDKGFNVVFDTTGGIKIENDYVNRADDTFTVEVEEEIEGDTRFEKTVRVTSKGNVIEELNSSIHSCLSWGIEHTQIFALINGKLELIWERGEEE